MYGKITAILLALLYVFCMPGFLSAQKTTKPLLEYQFWYDDSGVVDRDKILGWTLAGTETLNFVGDRLILGSVPGVQTANERLMRLGIAGILLFPFHDTFNTAGHEYGHFRAYSRAGMRNFEFFERADSDQRRAAYPFLAVELMFRSHWLAEYAIMPRRHRKNGFAHAVGILTVNGRMRVRSAEPAD